MPVALDGTPEEAALGDASPILIGLLALAVLLLGAAALPASAVRGNLAYVLVQRRLELGLIGVAVLASAAIGLGIALLAG